jgi:hypothetical protein
MLLDEIAQGLMLGGGPILLTGGVRIPAIFHLDQYVLSCFPHPLYHKNVWDTFFIFSQSMLQCSRDSRRKYHVLHEPVWLHTLGQLCL